MNQSRLINFLHKLTASSTDAPIFIIRLSVGVIFVSEGAQKFLFPDAVGAGRFAKIGLPSPELLAPLVGTFEMACGALVLVGLATRLAVIPLIAVMLTAIVSTKVPILLESGFWKMAHETRTDYAMLLSLVFLWLAGAGRCSLDHRLWGCKRQDQGSGS